MERTGSSRREANFVADSADFSSFSIEKIIETIGGFGAFHSVCIDLRTIFPTIFDPSFL